MAKIDLYETIKNNKAAKTIDLQEMFVKLIEKLMNDKDVAAGQKDKLARLRAYIDIQLK